jgi:putative endonuclease
MRYYTYILYSISLDRFYIGSCENIEARLRKHLADHKGFTGKAKDWTIRLAEEYHEKSIALKRERQLKDWKSKERVWQFIDRCHKELYEIGGGTLEPFLSSVGRRKPFATGE